MQILISTNKLSTGLLYADFSEFFVTRTSNAVFDTAGVSNSLNMNYQAPIL